MPGNIATFNACVGAAFLPFLVTLYDTKVNAVSERVGAGQRMDENREQEEGPPMDCTCWLYTPADPRAGERRER